MKNIEEMSYDEYQSYLRLVEANKTGKGASFDDINLIWKTFISKATLCNTCASMKANAFSKIIRYFESKKHLIPTFNYNDTVSGTVNDTVNNIINNDEYMTPLIDEMMKKMEERGIGIRLKPDSDVDPSTVKVKKNEQRSCLWCGSFFKALNPNHMYCTTDCRMNMRLYRKEQRELKNKKL